MQFLLTIAKVVYNLH